jgi:hypothetical protein
MGQTNQRSIRRMTLSRNSVPDPKNPAETQAHGGEVLASGSAGFLFPGKPLPSLPSVAC